MEKVLFDWPIVLQYDVKAKNQLISRKFSGMKFFFTQALAYPTKSHASLYLFDKPVQSLYFHLFLVSFLLSHVFSSRLYQNRSNFMENGTFSLTYIQEELDSEEEWDYLVEVTEQAASGDTSTLRNMSPTQETSISEQLMTDTAFTRKVQSALEGAAAQVLDGLLEGASRLRQILRVLRSLLTTAW